MTRDQIVLALQEEYAKLRDQNLLDYERRVSEVCKSCDGLQELIDERRAILMAGIRNAFYANQKDNDTNAGMKNALQRINLRINITLKDNGLNTKILNPIYQCAICRDEGYIYNPSRQMCECFEKELNRRMLKELGLNGEHTFENFDPAIFSKDDPKPVSQWHNMMRNRDICQKYADSFPETDVKDLLFTGQSGLGKTYLMHAIAHRITERGYTVEYVSAFRLLNIFRKAYFENNNNLLNELIAVPLLLIDDLGTEPLMENITVTQLFNLLNERQNRGKHTVISTNLQDELKTRYTERITSRFRDESRCKTLKFIGDDVRPTLKKK